MIRAHTRPALSAALGVALFAAGCGGAGYSVVEARSETSSGGGSGFEAPGEGDTVVYLGAEGDVTDGAVSVPADASGPGATDVGTVGDPASASDVVTPDTAASDTGGPAGVDSVLPVCGDQTVSLAKITPGTVLFVVDRSQSMKGQKWTDAQSAIKSITASYDATLRFGLILFPTEDSVCTVSTTLDVPFGLQNAAGVGAILDTAILRKGTPTGGALVAAAQVITALPADAPRVVVLATDGAPTCASDCSTCAGVNDGLCAMGACSACINKQACIMKELSATVTGLLAQGIETYVIGLPGSEAASDKLDTLAVAGGTAQAGATKYYAVTDAASLVAALGTIAGSVSSCSAEVEPTPGYAFMTVKLDGAKLPKDPTHQNGWDLLDGHTLQLYGDACTAASAPSAHVDVTWICKY